MNVLKVNNVKNASNVINVDKIENITNVNDANNGKNLLALSLRRQIGIALNRDILLDCLNSFKNINYLKIAKIVPSASIVHNFWCFCLCLCLCNFLFFVGFVSSSLRSNVIKVTSLKGRSLKSKSKR